MEVVQWTPGIKYPAHLYLTARLLCTFCRTETEVETIDQLFYGIPTADGGRIGNTDSSIGTVLGDLWAERSCEHCGIVSIIPKMERERLLAETYSQLTTDWFKTEQHRMREAEATPA